MLSFPGIYSREMEMLAEEVAQLVECLLTWHSVNLSVQFSAPHKTWHGAVCL